MLSQFRTGWRILPWVPNYVAQRLRRQDHTGPVHFIIAIADHFEPCSQRFRGHGDPVERVTTWFRAYKAIREQWRDDEGWPLRHTFFYPAEQYATNVVDAIQKECRSGWGELEVHLHHGIDRPASSDETRTTLIEFRERLASHGCLAEWTDTSGDIQTVYGFVHGNWALANSAGGAYCGVDDEMQILADTGCYADFTLPSAPSPGQVRKINALYECGLPFTSAVPHRTGHDLRVGERPTRFPLIVQGPLVLFFRRGRLRLDNAAVTGPLPASLDRVIRWRDCGIHVQGRPEWVFVKLHCHGMNTHDRVSLVGEPMGSFLKDLRRFCNENRCGLHFVTCREMTNIAIAATCGEQDNPGSYREYFIRSRTLAAIP